MTDPLAKGHRSRWKAVQKRSSSDSNITCLLIIFQTQLIELRTQNYEIAEKYKKTKNGEFRASPIFSIQRG